MAGTFSVAAFLTIFANVVFVRGSVQAFYEHPALCGAKKLDVPLDHPRYQYFPHYVEIYRCSGGCTTDPKTTRCAATNWNNITGLAVDLATGLLKEISIVNHTSCRCACITKATDCTKYEDFKEGICGCQCKYPDQPPTPCPERFSWNSFQCKCVCQRVEFCSSSKEWSHKACGCVCTSSAVEMCKSEKKHLNATTCECEDPIVRNVGPGVTGKRTAEEINWKRLLAVMLAELIVLIVLFDLYLYWRYKKGVFHWIHDNCRWHPKDTTTNAPASTPGNNANADTGRSHESQNHSPTLTRTASKSTIV